MEKKKELFLRIGAKMMLTESEFNLLCQENEESTAMIKAKLECGDYKIEGETYFPTSFDESDEAWFLEKDIDFNFWEDED